MRRGSCDGRGVLCWSKLMKPGAHRIGRAVKDDYFDVLVLVFLARIGKDIGESISNLRREAGDNVQIA